MWMPDLKLDFAGFRPSLSLSNQVREIASDVSMKAPSDSFMKATIHRIVDGTGEAFEGIFRITSSVGTFLVHERDTDVLRLVERLKDRIGGQLANWKLHRFADEAGY